MSTHYIEEAERLADTVTIMSRGTAVAAGRPADLVAEHAGPEAIEVYGPPERLAEVEARRAARRAADAAHGDVDLPPDTRPRAGRRCRPGSAGRRTWRTSSCC